MLYLLNYCVVFSNFLHKHRSNLVGSDIIKYVRRPAGKRFHRKYTILTVKHGGGSIMVWACFWDYGTSILCFIFTNKNSNKYLYILEDSFLPFVHGKYGDNLIFRQTM